MILPWKSHIKWDWEVAKKIRGISHNHSNHSVGDVKIIRSFQTNTLGQCFQSLTLVKRMSTCIRFTSQKFMNSKFHAQAKSVAATATTAWFNIKHTLSFFFILPHSLHLSNMRLSFPHIRNLTVTQLFVDKCLFALLIMFTFPHIWESFLRSILKFNRTINHHHFHLINFREFKLNAARSFSVFLSPCVFALSLWINLFTRLMTQYSS